MIKHLMKHMRRSTLDFRTKSGRTIADVVFSPLGEQSVSLIDVGARNGQFLVPQSYASRCELIGFEPNPVEYQKLVDYRMDSIAAGADIPTFKALTYYPYAIAEADEDKKFYITAGAGACTLMGADDAAVTSRIYLEGQKRSYHDAHTQINAVIDVPCRRLDGLLDEGRTYDFLKIDAEGAEFDILEGARRLFETKRILFIYSEFVAFGYYRGRHPVFGDQHALLNSLGYRLLGLDLGHRGYSRDQIDLPADSDERLLYAGDGFFCVDPDRHALTPDEKQRLALIAMVFGFNSFALSLLREAGLNSIGEIHEVHDAIRSSWTIRRLKKAWAALPTTLANMVRR